MHLHKTGPNHVCHIYVSIGIHCLPHPPADRECWFCTGARGGDAFAFLPSGSGVIITVASTLFKGDAVYAVVAQKVLTPRLRDRVKGRSTLH